MKNMIYLLATLIACLSSQFAMAEQDGEKTIAILNSPEPIEYRMENEWIGGALLVGVPWLINKGRNGNLSGNLTTALIESKPNETLRNQISEILEQSGINLTQPPQVSINPVKPWDVKYGTINTAGKPFLHVYVERIGIQSRGTSRTYQPFVDVVFCLVPPNGKDCAIGDRSYYGDGYTQEDYLVYPADVADQWADSDDVFRRVKSVDTALAKGIKKIAGGVAQEVIKYLAENSSNK